MRLLASWLLYISLVQACSWDYQIWIPRSRTADPMYRFVRDGQAGYIDQTGKVVIPPAWQDLGNGGGEFENGRLRVRRDRRDVYVDSAGKVVIDQNASTTWDFSDGLAVVFPDHGHWGFIDPQGRFAIPATFPAYPKGLPSSFNEGLAAIAMEGRYGYMDKSGAIVIPPQFSDASEFSEDRARVVIGGPCYRITEGPCGAPTIAPYTAKPAADLPLCEFTYIDRQGRPFTTRVERGLPFSEGRAAAQLKGKWGYLDKSGNWAIQPQFAEVASFSDGLAAVRQDALWGYIDLNGAMVIAPQFASAGEFRDGLAPVPGGTGMIYINRQGAPAFEETFSIASHFHKGLAHVSLRRKPGQPVSARFAYIDRTGRHVFEY